MKEEKERKKRVKMVGKESEKAVRRRREGSAREEEEAVRRGRKRSTEEVSTAEKERSDGLATEGKGRAEEMTR